MFGMLPDRPGSAFQGSRSLRATRAQKAARQRVVAKCREKSVLACVRSNERLGDKSRSMSSSSPTLGFLHPSAFPRACANSNFHAL